jgi:hypothetical protein
MHTLIVASRFDETSRVEDPSQQSHFGWRDDPGYLEPISMRLSYRNKLELYSAEPQQIWQTTDHTTMLGARFQTADLIRIVIKPTRLASQWATLPFLSTANHSRTNSTLNLSE